MCSLVVGENVCDAGTGVGSAAGTDGGGAFSTSDWLGVVIHIDASAKNSSDAIRVRMSLGSCCGKITLFDTSLVRDEGHIVSEA